jgi:hypothetical protein
MGRSRHVLTIRERCDGRSPPPPGAVLGAPAGDELGGSDPITAAQVGQPWAAVESFRPDAVL